MEYQSVSDLAQLQMLHRMLLLVLQGILLACTGGLVLLLGLCVSELRLPRRRPSTDTSPDALREANDRLRERALAMEPGAIRPPAALPRRRTGSIATAANCTGASIRVRS